MQLRANRWTPRRLSYPVIAAIIALPMASSGTLAAPSQLYGKSVIVSWQEDRVQTTDRDAQPTSVTGSGQLSVYVSEAGRAFSRVSMSVSNRRGTRSGNRDAVQGEGSARSVNFHGNAMSASMPRGNAGAMQISVTFDSGYQGCSARVVTGKTGGAQSTRVTSMINGRQYEFYSVKTSGESCRAERECFRQLASAMTVGDSGRGAAGGILFSRQMQTNNAAEWTASFAAG